MNRRDPLGRQQTPEERQRRHRFGIIRSVAILAGLILLGVWFALQQGPEVLSITTARGLDDAYRPLQPTSTYAPGDTVHLSVEMRGYRAGMDVAARLLYEGEVITEAPLAAPGEDGSYAGVALSPEPAGWPVGEYVVDIMFEDHLLNRTTFEVAAGQE